jgi:hypothetical protein
MTGKSEVVNTHGHKYYPIRPSVPCEQIITKQTELPKRASYVQILSKKALQSWKSDSQEGNVAL